MSWAAYQSTEHTEEPSGGRAGPERGEHGSQDQKRGETVESQKELELGWTDQRTEERKGRLADVRMG